MAYRAHPDYVLIVAANRDEFFQRPTAPVGYWQDCPEVLAGRDLQQGGTWMGVNRAGRFAALTNVREPLAFRGTAKSRGLIVADFLTGDTEPRAHLTQLAKQRDDYNGFNLVCGSAKHLYTFGTVDGHIAELPPGVFGLSNHKLDTPWPKVESSKRALQNALAHRPEELESELFSMLSDTTLADDADLPNTGVGIEKERWLSPIFIHATGYGTRSSTLLLVDYAGNARFVERTFNAEGEPDSTRRFALKMQ